MIRACKGRILLARIVKGRTVERSGFDERRYKTYGGLRAKVGSSVVIVVVKDKFAYMGERCSIVRACEWHLADIL